jgi:hypothetical protein
MIRGLGIVMGGLLVGACSVVGVRSGTEQPAYQVVDRLEGGVEIRRYAPRLAAETTVATADGQAGRSQAFRRLADFIFGANRAQAKVAMTAPVQLEAGPSTIAMTAPVATQARDDSLTMRFFMPASYTLDTLPEPLDPAIRIVAVPEETLAVLRFSGSTGRAAVTAREAELSRILAGSSWQPQGEPVAQFYDPPWTLPFLRRNEVAVAVTGPG